MFAHHSRPARHLRRLLLVTLALGIAALGTGALWQSPPACVPVASAGDTQEQDGAAGSKGSAKPAIDLHGDPLPPGAIARLGTVRFRLPFFVHGLACTPDEKTLASACWDGSVRLWDPETGKETGRFRVDSTPTGRTALMAVAITPDGKTLIAMENHDLVHVWDLATGKERRQLKGGNGFCLALSPDGKTIAKGLSGERKGEQVVLWDVDTGEKLRGLWATTRIVHGLAFSRDGKLLAAGDDAPLDDKDGASSVRLWDPADGRLVRELKGHTGGITAIAFSPADKRLASASHDGTIRLWDPADGRHIRSIAVPDDHPCSEPLGINGVHYGGVLAIAFSPDGQWLASGSYDGTVRLWNVETGKPLQTMYGHGREVVTILFSKNGKVLTSGSFDHSIRRWDLESGRELQVRDCHDGPVGGVVISPDGRLAATCSGYSIHLWSLATGKRLHMLRAVPGHANCIAFSPDGRALASAGDDGKIVIWDTAGGREVRQILGHDGAVYNVAFTSVQDMLLSTGKDGTLRFWDWSTGKQLRNIPSDDGCFGLAVSTDGRVAVTGGNQVRLWDVATGKMLRKAELPWSSFALSPDGQSLVTLSRDSAVKSWNVRSGKQEQAFLGPPYSGGFVGTPGILLSPDGRLLGRTGSGGITLWEMATGKVRRHFTGHQRVVWAFAFAPDGRTVLTGGDDTTVLVWDLARRHDSRPDRLTPAELEALWRDLGGDDAQRADQAIAMLGARADQTLAFFEKRVAPIKSADAKRVTALLADLDSDDFALRQSASKDLERLGERAAAALKKAVEKPASLESRRRVETLLSKLRPPLASSELLQSLRAVEVLERIDTADARRLLRSLAEGIPDARLTREAKSALDRLTRP